MCQTYRWLGSVAAFGLWFTVGFSGGCAVDRRAHYEAVTAEAAAPWRTNVASPGTSAGARDVVSWWRGLNDAVFSELAERALHANLDLAVARARIVEARARRGVVNADRLPQVDVEAEYTRAGSGDDSLAFAAPPPGGEADVFAAGVVAGWEIDLWGRVKRLVDAADADSAAEVADYRDAAVSVISELALAYVDVRTLDARLKLVQENIRLQQRLVDLALSRFEAGSGPELDVTQARRLLRRTQARVPELRSAKAIAENRVAILLGKRPADNLIPQGDLPTAQHPAEMGLPADLIVRRADVRGAAWRYRAALARIDAAELERLPRLSLSGSFRLSADEAAGLLDEVFVYSFGPTLRFPLYDGQRISANVRVRESQAEQARLALQQTLLRAIREVEDAVVGYVRMREQVDALQRAAEDARRSARLAEQLYEAGLRGLAQSLDAQRELVAVEDDLAVSRQRVLAEAIRLYRALGGGWEMMSLNGEITSTARDAALPATTTQPDEEGAS